MFFVWIVSMAKVVVDFDCLDDASDSLGAEGGDAASHYGSGFAEVAAQLVVEIF